MSGIPPFIPRAQTSRHLVRTTTSPFLGTDWKRITGTSHGTPGTESTHAHGLGVIPKYVIIERLTDRTKTVYESSDPDATNIAVKALGASQAFVAWVLK